MLLTRSDEMLKQVEAMSALKRELLERLAACFPQVNEKVNRKKKDFEASSEREFIQTIELSAESFDLDIRRVPLAEVDRTSTMLVGPFYTSDEYPIPTSRSGMLCPIVQIDLKSASMTAGEFLGDGLLQLWYDTSDPYPSDGHIRIIPREEFEGNTATTFNWTAPDDLDASPLPMELWFEPDQDEVSIIVGIESTGLRSQGSYIELFSDELDDQLTDEIRGHLQAFRDGTEYTNSMHLFGTFYPIQYSASDVGMKCLFNFPAWGSSGNAQIFFKVFGADSFVFMFRECVR